MLLHDKRKDQQIRKRWYHTTIQIKKISCLNIKAKEAKVIVLEPTGK
jgi:hypothetical protein